MSENENWREIFDGKYAVSDQGRVKRIGNIRPNHAHLSGVVLKYGSGTGGYLSVTLYRPGGRKGTFRIHALVAAAFIGEKPHGLSINHKNGNKTDNRAVNLEYVNHKQNKTHAIKLGLIARGESQGSRKLTDDRVRAIRNSTFPIWVLARIHGVSTRTIYGVKRRVAWKHVL